MVDARPQSRPPSIDAGRSDALADAAHSERHDTDGDARAAAAEALRACGERLTEPRLAVLGVLAAHADHLSADRIAVILESGPRPVHRATVYRTLDRLASVGVAATLTLPGGPTLYHLAATRAGHGHLHARCRSCGAVSMLPLSTMAEAQRIAAGEGFELDAAHSTLVGRCAACAARATA